MNAVFVITVCLLASVGIVQALGWLVMGLRRYPEWGNVLQVIPMRRDPEELEAQLRYELFLLRWSTSPRPQYVVLLDPGLEEESREICRNLLCGAAGVTVCTPEELSGLAHSLTAAARG